MSTTHSLAESDDGEEIDLGLDCFEEFKELYKRSWAHYKSKLLTDYVRAAYVLSPDPKVYDDARANIEPEDREACERLLIKLFLPGYVRDVPEWEQKKATMIDEFLSDLHDFHNKAGYFNKMHIWIAAGSDDMMAYLWHSRYSYLFTKWLGKLGAIVCAKGTGICEAERNWKENKKVRGGQRSKLTPQRTSQLATISASHSMTKAKARQAAARRVGKLMNDEDFKIMNLGESFAAVVASHFELTMTLFLQVC